MPTPKEEVKVLSLRAKASTLELLRQICEVNNRSHANQMEVLILAEAKRLGLDVPHHNRSSQ